MKVYQIAIAAAAVLSAAEAKGAKRKLIRGVATDEAAEDSQFWERQLGGSARRLNEDSEFWQRQLGGSARRLAKVEEDIQDDKFWQRELGGSS